MGLLLTTAANYTSLIFYGVVRETGRVDYECSKLKAREIKPKLIICSCAYSRDWDYERIRKVADEVGALVMADIAHRLA